MIRIDEIYNNVFLPNIMSKPEQTMHYFHPFGTTDVENICTHPQIIDRKRCFLFWDQEPYYPEIHRSTILKFNKQYTHRISLIINNMRYATRVSYQPTIFGYQNINKFKFIKNDFVPYAETTVITSEKNSANINELCDTYGFKKSYYFFHGWAALDWFRGYNHAFLISSYKDRNITNTFICPNRVVSGKREHRVNLFKQLVQHDLIVNNKVSFPKYCPYSNEKIDIDNVILPLVLDNEEEGNIANESYKISLWEQSKESLLYVITETVYKEETLHLTEKTFKPIAMQMPFILVGAQYNLEYLRSYGFKTFGDFWSEDYDNQNNEDRLTSITALLTDLNDLSLKEKAQLQKHISPVVEYNFNWFYNGGFENVLWTELNDMINKW